MRRISFLAVAVAVVCMAAFGHIAFAQSGCVGQMKPLKPLMVPGCRQTVAPICMCDQSWNCRWEWPCGGSERRESERREGIDTSIYSNQVLFQFDTPSEVAIRAEQLRLLQQESILQQQEIRRRNLEAKIQQSEREIDALMRSAVDRWAAKEAEKAAPPAGGLGMLSSWLAARAAKEASKEAEKAAPSAMDSSAAATESGGTASAQAPAENWFTRNAPAEAVPVAAPARRMDPLDRLLDAMPPAQKAEPPKPSAQAGLTSRSQSPGPPTGSNNGNDPCFITNGHIWKIIPQIAKTVHLAGFAEAYAMDRGRFPEGWNAPTIIPFLDQLYEDPANLRIPTVWAVKLIAMKAGGADEPTIEKERSTMRGALSACPPLP
jgi:hypothetical protein